VFTIERLTDRGWIHTEEHEDEQLAQLKATLKSQADGMTYRVTSPDLETLCVVTSQGSRCWHLNEPQAA
jgi:hypothetical protein